MLKRQSLLVTISLALFISLGWFTLNLIGSRTTAGLIALPPSVAQAQPTATAMLVAATATPVVVEMNLNDDSVRPFIPTATEHWAEVNLNFAQVTLYQGELRKQMFPMSYGRGDTPNTTTYAGLFTVYAKNASLHQSVVAGEYIRNWVGFDQRWANGFHSVIMDRSGQVIDQRLGQAISSGCIRTAMADSATIFAWLPYGAHVWVHQ